MFDVVFCYFAVSAVVPVWVRSDMLSEGSKRFEVFAIRLADVMMPPVALLLAALVDGII